MQELPRPSFLSRCRCLAMSKLGWKTIFCKFCLQVCGSLKLTTIFDSTNKWTFKTMAVADCVKISFEACIWMRFLYWISVFGFRIWVGCIWRGIFLDFHLGASASPLRVICVNSVKVTLHGEVDVTERRDRATLNSWLYYGGQLACMTGALWAKNETFRRKCESKVGKKGKPSSLALREMPRSPTPFYQCFIAFSSL